MATNEKSQILLSKWTQILAGVWIITQEIRKESEDKMRLYRNRI